jgi:hypothetical protein
MASFQEALPGAVNEPAPGTTNRKRASIELQQKACLSLDDPCFKEVPEDVMKILRMMDLAGNNQLALWELDSNMTMLQELKIAADQDGSGNVSPAEVQSAVDLLKRLSHAKLTNSTDMEYKHMPPKLQEVFKTWDADESGVVSEAELIGAASAWKKMQAENRTIKKLLLAAVVVMIIMFAGMFAMGMVTAELAKEMKATGDGTMKTTDGTVVKVSSSDVSYDASGKMVARSGTSGRRLEACTDANGTCFDTGAGVAAIGTRLSKQEAPLSSVIPDRYLREVKELMLDAADGSSFQVQVSASVRVVDPEAKCGSVIRLTTPHGVVTLDDTELYFPDSLVEHALSLGVELEISMSARVGYGRRLSSVSTLKAAFNFIENYDWKCESVQKPPPPPREFRAELSLQWSCSLGEKNHDPCASKMSDQTGFLRKPGVEVTENGEQRLEVPESVVSSNNVTISVVANPNHPLVRRVHIFDHVAKRKVSYRLFQGVQYECASVPAEDSEDDPRGEPLVFHGDGARRRA